MPRFVVLFHETPPGHSRGDHYDLMLEHGEVLWTWACERLPQPGETIDAQRLPDHRLAYLDFEGELSGDRGRVSRVDSGKYELLEAAVTQVRIRLSGAVLCGAITLTAGSEPNRWTVAYLG